MQQVIVLKKMVDTSDLLRTPKDFEPFEIENRVKVIDSQIRGRAVVVITPSHSSDLTGDAVDRSMNLALSEVGGTVYHADDLVKYGLKFPKSEVVGARQILNHAIRENGEKGVGFVGLEDSSDSVISAIHDKPEVDTLLLINPRPHLERPIKEEILRNALKGFMGRLYIAETEHSLSGTYNQHTDFILEMAVNASHREHIRLKHAHSFSNDEMDMLARWAFGGAEFRQREASNTNYFKLVPTDDKKSLLVVIHPNTRGKVLISTAGCGGTLEGYEGKYEGISKQLQKEGMAVVRMAPAKGPGDGTMTHYSYDFEKHVRDLKRLIRYVRENALDITGAESPEIMLAGVSAGANAAIVAAKEEGVRKVLMISPSIEIDMRELEKRLKGYDGEAFIVHGTEDKHVPPDTSQFYHKLLNGSTLQLLDGVGHAFKGSTGSKLFTGAYRWFALGDNRYPSPDTGIVLYE